MNKINFKNLPSTETPINAENLNLLQTNVENSFIVQTGINIEEGRGTSGYFHVLDISNTGGQYLDQYIEIDILQRGRYGKIRFNFKDKVTTELEINNIEKEGNINAYYIIENNIFKLYISKANAYDRAEIYVKKGHYSSQLQISWINQSVTSLPSGSKEVLSGN